MSLTWIRSCREFDWVLLGLVVAYNLCMAGMVAALCMMTYIAVR